MSLLEVNGLSKRYGDHTAVSGLTFTVEKGQIYGFLGPNGAGKSTTMNMITGCLSATEGSAVIDGHDIFEDAVAAKKCIGYLPEIPPLYPDMTPFEYLNFVAKAKGIAKNKRAKQVELAISKTGLEQMQDRLIKHLSKGYKQRVGIAQALLGNPQLIILDEPTVGLDPKQIIEIRNLILSLKGQHTVILSSHILSEVQAVCDRILIISHGKMVACDTSENLETMFAGRLTIQLRAKCSADRFDTLIKTIDGVKMESYVMEENGVYGSGEISASGDMDADTLCEQVFNMFASVKIPLLSMQLSKASLEDIFLELTSEEHEQAIAQEEAAQKEKEKAKKGGKEEFDTLGVTLDAEDEEAEEDAE